jgi:hypothetical protein
MPPRLLVNRPGPHALVGATHAANRYSALDLSQVLRAPESEVHPDMYLIHSIGRTLRSAACLAAFSILMG